MLVPISHWRLSTLVLAWISGKEISLWRNDEEERLIDLHQGVNHHIAYHISSTCVFFLKNSHFLIISFRHDAQGNSAISYIVRATSHLLDPRGSEFSASFVGRLVTTLIKKVSETIIYLET